MASRGKGGGEQSRGEGGGNRVEEKEGGHRDGGGAEYLNPTNIYIYEST